MSRQSTYTAGRNQLFYTLGNKPQKEKLNPTNRMGAETQTEQSFGDRRANKIIDKGILGQRYTLHYLTIVTIAHNNFDCGCYSQFFDLKLVMQDCISSSSSSFFQHVFSIFTRISNIIKDKVTGPVV